MEITNRRNRGNYLYVSLLLTLHYFSLESIEQCNIGSDGGGCNIIKMIIICLRKEQKLFDLFLVRIIIKLMVVVIKFMIKM